MKLRVSHLTRYEYAQPVSFSPHALYLRPRETPLIRLNRYTFNVSPNAKLTPSLDAFGNVVTTAQFWDRSAALNIRTECEVETLETNPFDFVLRSDCVSYPPHYDAYEQYMLAPYLLPASPEAGVALDRWLSSTGPSREETVPFLTRMARRLADELTYESRENPSIQAPEVTLGSQQGASRDYAAAFGALCRRQGIAARYVSGYLYTTDEDPQHTKNAMHAWAEVFLPGAGWKGIDPTHGIFCTEAYIPLAHAPQGECVGAVQGSYYSSVRVPSHLITNVLVERI